MNTRNLLYSILIAICVSACQGGKGYVPNLPDNVSTVSMRTIDVEITNSVYDHLDEWLEADRYVRLPAEPLIAEIRDIHVEDDKIFVHDKMHRLLCYDMDGEFLWKIDALGPGPGEYAGISHFAVNPDEKEVLLYDNLGQKLLYYGMRNGKFIRAERLAKPNPTEAIRFWSDICAFVNCWHKLLRTYGISVEPPVKTIRLICSAVIWACVKTSATACSILHIVFFMLSSNCKHVVFIFGFVLINSKMLSSSVCVLRLILLSSTLLSNKCPLSFSTNSTNLAYLDGQ